MSSVVRVPEHPEWADEELTFSQARRTVQRADIGRLLRESFVRFRYGDGFSHSRALALQLCLAIVPLIIAVVGLSSRLQAAGIGRVLRLTIVSLLPGSEDALLRTTLVLNLEGEEEREETATTALVGGLLFGLLALIVAMAQVERGANRIYGVPRDRPILEKYSRASVLAVLAGLPALSGLLLIVGGNATARSLEQVYGLDRLIVGVLRWPVALALSLGAITLLLRHAPRRQRQPGWSWLGLGAGIALAFWMTFTGLLAVYFTLSGSFGAVYGQLTSIMALLLWAQLSSMAILFGVAFTAQLEAERAGLPHAALPDLQPRRPEAVGGVDVVAAGMAGLLDRFLDLVLRVARGIRSRYRARERGGHRQG